MTQSKIRGIKYCGYFFRHDGYGEAARNIVMALRERGVPLTLELADNIDHQKLSIKKFEKFYEMITELLNKKIDYNVKIIHTVPDNFPAMRENGVANLGFTYWETSRIIPSWTQKINQFVNAQIVCCDYNRNAFLDSGVTKPIIKFLPIFDAASYNKSSGSLFKGDDTYKFYSIGTWNPRKNQYGLLKAYLAEFGPNEKVSLVLKTYSGDNTESGKNKIKSIIYDLMDSVKSHVSPRIIFIGGILSRNQVMDIHKSCDCFVMPHKSEGLGIPHAESMFFGNPIITTGLGGNMEFMNESVAYLLKYKMVDVAGMPWVHWYKSDQKWAEPNVDQLRKYMRDVFENQEEAAKKGRMGRDYITKTLNTNITIDRFIKDLNSLL